MEGRQCRNAILFPSRRIKDFRLSNHSISPKQSTLAVYLSPGGTCSNLASQVP
jgi:hypothetical protein